MERQGREAGEAPTVELPSRASGINKHWAPAINAFISAEIYSGSGRPGVKAHLEGVAPSRSPIT